MHCVDFHLQNVSLGFSFDLWGCFLYAELTVNVRQKEDLRYAEMLGRIRVGAPSMTDIEALKERMIQQDEMTYSDIAVFLRKIREGGAETVCLLPINEAVNAVNSEVLDASTTETINIPVRTKNCENYAEN